MRLFFSDCLKLGNSLMIKKPSTLIWLLFVSSLMPLAVAEAQNFNQKIKRLDVGDKAINFDLPEVGKDDYVELKDLYAEGPVVVIVLRGYPGYQCPLCSKQVGAMINRVKALKAAAHKVVLIYPGESSELERQAKKFMGSRTLPEPMILVRDPDMEMVSEWGLRWNAPRETAYPATYIVKSNGRIAWRKVSNSHAGRSNAQEIIEQLKKL